MQRKLQTFFFITAIKVIYIFTIIYQNLYLHLLNDDLSIVYYAMLEENIKNA